MEKLKALGLNKYESEAYLSLLNLGTVTAYRLSENSEVPFGRIYGILDSLENKGLVTMESKDPKKYRAVEPKTGLRALLNEKDKEWQDKKKELKELIDSLEYQKKDSEPVKIIKSKEVYYRKIKESAEEAESEILFIAGNLSADKRTKIQEIESKFIEDGGTGKYDVKSRRIQY